MVVTIYEYTYDLISWKTSRAINSTVIKNSTTLEATMALNTLGESNEITLRWIPAHCGYEGNELTDQLAKRGSNNDRATRIKLPQKPIVASQ